MILVGDGKSVRVDVETVKTPELRARGLMHRKKLADRAGMLFLFDREQILSFWMRNTLISLDMVFINNDKKIVGILENVPPLNEKSRRVDVASRFVLEVNAGFCKKHNVNVGSQVTFEL